ncbi:Unknown protein, partial [Striga hermonthica]
DPSFWRRLWEVLEGIKSFTPSFDLFPMAEKEGVQKNFNEDFRATWTDKRPSPIPNPKPPLQVFGFPLFGAHAPSGGRMGEETPITPPGVKIPVLTQGEASHVRNTSGEVNGRESTETFLNLRKQPGPLESGKRPLPQIEEQMLTITQSEMQRMIAEAVAAQIKQTPVEQPRSSVRTVNPQARNDTLEQLLEQVRDLQARVEGRKTESSRGHSFSQHILDADLPQWFWELNIWYDGSTDPSRHLRSSENMAVLHRYKNPVQCRAFLTTLRGPAQDWFHQFPPGAVRDFDGFSSSFLNQFASVKAQEKSYLTLIGMQQKEGESLRDYVARYTRACVDVPSATKEIKSGGLTRGLLPGLCRNSLEKQPGRTFDEVLG